MSPVWQLYMGRNQGFTRCNHYVRMQVLHCKFMMIVSNMTVFEHFLRMYNVTTSQRNSVDERIYWTNARCLYGIFRQITLLELHSLMKSYKFKIRKNAKNLKTLNAISILKWNRIFLNLYLLQIFCMGLTVKEPDWRSNLTG